MLTLTKQSGIRAARVAAVEFVGQLRLVGRSPNTVVAYEADLQHFFEFCAARRIDPFRVRGSDVARYVGHMREPSKKKGGAPARDALAPATLRRRLSCLRGFYGHLLSEGLTDRNPVRAGAHSKSTRNVRPLVTLPSRVPRIPSQEQWTSLIEAAATRGLRDLTMLLVQYDGALRREELIRLRLVDVLPLANGNVRVQSGKGGSARIVNSSAATRTILERYIAVRFKDAQSPDEPLFVGDGARNRGKILSLSTWSKTVSALAVTTSLKNVSTHTMRHLRLTHLAMAGWDLHEISRYAGHASLDSTMLYIHLAESLTNTSYSRTSKVIDAWVERTVTRLANEGLIPAHAGVAQ